MGRNIVSERQRKKNRAGIKTACIILDTSKTNMKNL